MSRLPFFAQKTHRQQLLATNHTRAFKFLYIRVVKYCRTLAENSNNEYKTYINDRTRDYRKGQKICQEQKPESIRYH